MVFHGSQWAAAIKSGDDRRLIVALGRFQWLLEGSCAGPSAARGMGVRNFGALSGVARSAKKVGVATRELVPPKPKRRREPQTSRQLARGDGVARDNPPIIALWSASYGNGQREERP
jgi:hypothetical protein